MNDGRSLESSEKKCFIIKSQEYILNIKDTKSTFGFWRCDFYLNPVLINKREKFEKRNYFLERKQFYNSEPISHVELMKSSKHRSLEITVKIPERSL